MIPILDLKAQYESIKDEIEVAIAEVLESTQFILGPAVRDLGGAGEPGSREVDERNILSRCALWKRAL